MRLKVGAVTTPYHTLSLKVKTTVDVMEEGQEPPQAPEVAAATTPMKEAEEEMHDAQEELQDAKEPAPAAPVDHESEDMEIQDSPFKTAPKTPAKPSIMEVAETRSKQVEENADPESDANTQEYVALPEIRRF